MRNFNDYYWCDSSIENIQIEFDKATLLIFNDVLKKYMNIVCTGFAGITNLCIWDDSFIFSYDLKPVTDDMDNEFLRDLYANHDKDFDYYIGQGDYVRKLDGLLELSMELSNHIRFRIYCLNVEVIELDEPTARDYYGAWYRV